jgi:hypothetical protein
MVGDAARALAVADDLGSRSPQATLVQSVWVQAVRAQVEINRENPGHGVELLRAASAYELATGLTSSLSYFGMHPAYLRARALLAAGQGREAAAEFQRILDHPGVVWNSWTGALARLGLGRAYALASQSAAAADVKDYKAKSRLGYEGFLTLWKDADPEIPILRAAQTEFAALH